MHGATVRGAQLLIEKGLFNPSGRPQHHISKREFFGLVVQRPWEFRKCNNNNNSLLILQNEGSETVVRSMWVGLPHQINKGYGYVDGYSIICRNEGRKYVCVAVIYLHI